MACGCGLAGTVRPVTSPGVVDRVYTPRVLAVFAATALYFSVGGLSFPVLPRLVEQELGGSKADIGLAFGVFAIGMLLVRPVAGWVLDRVGRRPVMLGGSLSVAGLQLLHVPAADTGELWVLLVVRVLMGAASSAMYLSQATVATELPNPEHRDRVFALFSTTVLVGFAVGQVVGEMVMQAHGFAWAFAVSAAFAGSSTIVSLALPETRPADAVPAASVSDLFHPAAVRIGIVNLLVFVGFMGFNAFIADYAEEFDIDDARWLLLTYSLTVMAMRVVRQGVHAGAATCTRNLRPRHGRCRGPSGHRRRGVQLYVAAFVIAVGMAWNVPLLILIAVDSATDAERSRAVATVTTFGDLANSAGTLALGFVAESVGYDGMYVVVAGSALAALDDAVAVHGGDSRFHVRPTGAAGLVAGQVCSARTRVS